MNIASQLKKIKKQRARKQMRVRGYILTNLSRPRLSVYRSSMHIYAQIIDDVKRHTLVSFSDLLLKEVKGTKVEVAEMVGAELAKLALKKKIAEVVFDRSWYKFHGRVKALAESARKNGLKF